MERERRMPRNCDVGTPEEQRERFEKFCSKYETRHEDEAYCSKRCPLSGCDSIVLCVLKWAQWPYDGECSKDKTAKKNSIKTKNKNNKETK